MGIDAWGWDAPLRVQAEVAIERNEQGIMWAAHQVDLPTRRSSGSPTWRRYPRPAFGRCFPLKISRASAAPARVVALVD